MKSVAVLSFALTAFCALPVRAQDAVKVSPDHYKIKLENEHVRVIENTLAPGEKDPMHTHHGARPGDVIPAGGMRTPLKTSAKRPWDLFLWK